MERRVAKLLTIDFEASCLPKHGRSFPIEVAIADLTGRTRSWLIRPHASWTDWTWTAEAEAVHGITRDVLARDGVPAWQVIAELVGAAAGSRVVADSPLDGLWLETLCAAGNTRPPFRIGHIRELVDELGSPPAEVERAIATADRAIPGRHRAAADASWLATVAASLTEASMRRTEDRPMFAWTAPTGAGAGAGPGTNPNVRAA
jgi:hypothetical protein